MNNEFENRELNMDELDIVAAGTAKHVPPPPPPIIIWNPWIGSPGPIRW